MRRRLLAGRSFDDPVGGLFYASVCLWSLLAFGLLRTEEGFGLDVEYLFKIVLPVATIGFAARWCARRVQKPRPAPPEPAMT